VVDPAAHVGGSPRSRALPTPGTPPRPVLPSKPPVCLPQALYDFTPNEANELGFRVGDVLTIVKELGDWWEAELNGKKGIVPGNYLQKI